MTEEQTEPAGQNADWDQGLVDIYGAHFGRLVTMARRMLHDTALAEEAVQEAFLRYHDADPSPAPGKELAYLQSVVMNVARSMIRRQQTARKWRRELPRFQPSPEESVIDQQQDHDLLEDLTSLSRRQREVLILRHCVDFSEREIAEQLNISPGSVKTHASRGRAALRVRVEHRQLVAAE